MWTWGPRIAVTLIALTMALATGAHADDFGCWERKPCDCPQKWWCEFYGPQPPKPANPPKIFPPAALPGFLAPNQQADVTFTASLTGEFKTLPVSIRLSSTDGRFAGDLRDDGKDPDLAPRDWVYSGKVTVSAAGLVHGQCIKFRASAGSVESPESELCVSGFVRAEQLTWQSHHLVDKSTGHEFSAGHVVLWTKDAAPYDGLKKVEKVFRCKVIQWFRKDLFILEFDRPLATVDELNQVLKKLRALPFVERADPDPITHVDLD